MATMSIRNLSEDTHRKIRFHAAELGVSVEEATRRLLNQATQSPEQLGDVLAAFAQAHDAEVIDVKRDQTPIRAVDVE